MTQRRRRGASGALVVAALLASCTGQGPPVFPTASRLPEGERRPDAVAVDLPSQPPPTRGDAPTADGVVTLRSPLGLEAAHATVRSFFRAVAREDLPTLTALLLPGAAVEDVAATATRRSSRAGRITDARSWWNQRFRKHEYEQLASRVVYREADIETYRHQELDGLPLATTTGDAPRRPEITTSDVVLRVPIVTHSVRSERLLGEELYFFLRRDGQQYLILHLAEPFPF